jgi:Domain of unknown function (DUF4157)
MQMEKTSVKVRQKQKAGTTRPDKGINKGHSHIPNHLGFGRLGSPTEIPFTPHNVLFLQRTIGNQAVAKVIQAKLKVGPPGDQYEQEADRVADKVMAEPGPGSNQPIRREVQEEDEIRQKPLAPSSTPLIQRQETSQEETEQALAEEDDQIEMVRAKQLRTAAKNDLEAGEQLESYLNRGGGSPITDEVRAFFESRMQADFSNVRVHANSEAAEMNRAIAARAFTHGRDIYFGAGEYAPDTTEGKRLLAHELTHVMQQGGGRHSPLDSVSKSPGSEVVQRFPALAAAEWIALGAAGYVVAQDATNSTAGDISYSFDEMEGVLLPGGGSDVAEYRKNYPDAKLQSHTHTVSTWIEHISGGRAMGIKFGLTFNYDGHAIGNISCNILETYDWPLWSGSVNVNFTPLSLSTGGVSVIRITLNLNADRTFAGGAVASRILELDGTGAIKKLGAGAHVRFNE